MKVYKGFLVVLACFLALFLSATQGYSQCQDPVKVAEDDSLFITIQEAYDYGSLNWTDFTLQLAGEIFTEDLFIDSGSVVLDGGYDCSFTIKNSRTSILGTITISTGAANFAGGIGITSSAACAFDNDSDGFTSIGSCSGSADDCNDNNADVYPGAPEICDGLDNNCDGQIDEGLTAVDADNDGYSAIGSCGGTADDCNDNDASINPGAVDIPYDGIDQDCSGADLTFAGEICIDCHAPESSWIGIHDLTTPPDGTCATCHAAPVNNVLSGHYGKTVNTDGNNMTAGSTIECVSCHDPDAANHTGGIALGTGTNFVGSKISSAWPNITCDTCHENRAALHSSAHSVEVGPNDLSYDPPGILCSSCHIVADWSQIEGVEHNVPTNGADSCSTCHNSPRAEVQITISSGTPPIHCLDCHSDKDQTVHGSHDATVFAWTASCGTASCHDSGSNTNISTLHNGCTTCHATSAGGLGTTVEGTAANGIDGDARLGAGAGYASSTCLTCHPSGTYSWEAVHTTTATQVNHSTSVGDLASCTTSCHETTGGNIQIAVDGTAGNEVHNGCADCHLSTGALDTSKNGTGIVLGTMASGNCGQCHTAAYFDNHAHHTTANNDVSYEIDGLDGSAATKADNDTSWTAEEGCAVCHTPTGGLGTWTGILNEHETGCGRCHSYDGSGAVDGPTVTAAITSGNPASCDTCHEEKTPAVNHGSHDATIFVWTASCGTASCHDSGTNTNISNVHNGCTTCHTTSAGGLGTTVEGTSANGIDGDARLGAGAGYASSTCLTCHPAATYSWESIHTVTQTPVDHSATVTNADTTCNGCHDAVVGGTAPDAIDTPFVAATEVHNNSDGQYSGTCANCHASDGSLQAAPTRAPLLSATGGNCSACHDVYFDNHTHSHATSVTGPVPPNTISENCLTSGCHVATTSPYEGAGEVHDAGVYAAGGCATCHTPGTGALINGTVGDATGTNGECANCHSVYFAGHLQHNDTTHLVSMGTDQSAGQSCNTSGCHGTFNDAWDHVSGNDIYALHNNTCTTCHDSARNDADGNVQAEIQEGAATCLECHATRSGAHGSHPADAFSWDSNCQDCHGAGAGTEQVVSVIHKNNCNITCHDGSGNRDNERIGDASFGIDGDATLADGTALAAESDINAWNTPTCTTCHPAATYSWTDIHTVTQTPADHSIAVSGISKCTSCHDATAGTPTGIPTSLANNMVHDECGACHNADGSLKAGASAGIDGVANCADCHGLYGTDFAAGHQNEDHGSVVAVAPCNSCHTGNVISSARIHEDNCFTSSCHVSSSDGTLTNSAAGHTVGSPSDCTDCHGAAGHNTDTDHNNRAISWTLGTTAPCNGCHSSDNDNIGQTGGGSLSSQADVDALHDKNWDGTVMANQCELCHWYVQAWDNPEGLPIAADIANYITAGKGTTIIECTDCHSYNANDHGGHTPADFGWSPSCSASACHNEAGNSDIIASPDVHNNECGLCHVSPGGGGTLRSYAIGQVISESTTCVTCHGTGPVGDMHHPNNTHAQAGDCTWCHADPRPGWPGTAPDPIPTQLFCIKCHVEPGGTGLVVYSNTYTPVNVSGFPSGDDEWPINGDASVQQTPVHTITGAAKINVQNYGACLGCHDGNTPGAAQIQIWHAKPTWNKDTHDTASSKYDNTFDVLRNAPGRSYYANGNTPPRSTSDAGATERRYNIFATGTNTGGVEKLRVIGRYRFGNASVDQPYDDDSTSSSQNRGKRLYKDYQDNTDNPWEGSPWPNRLRIPRNSFNNPQGLLSSDPHVPLP